MNSDKMISIITSGSWKNIETDEICSFSWTVTNQSINIHFKSGNKAGRGDSHKFVKIYHSKKEMENCNVIRFQSNLFTSEFKLCSENGPLHVVSAVFGKMNLEKI
ncbi:hypothetical protein ACT3CE_06705 [Marinifilum sp. RC60d5]|uniref:hypothetical protein n=1 Tax=Marinifilum sp. RC60d5 TaxID=3458414 RepID=UPI004036C3B5